ncbi:MAG: trimethylamine methyltransferase family protein [Thiolinea sp.]
MMEAVGNRRRGRGQRTRERLTVKVDMLPGLRRGLPLTEPMDEEQIQRIDAASMAILEEVGVDFRDPIALDDWKKAGADAG